MLNLCIRTNRVEGGAPLYTRLKVNGKSLWINLQLSVSIEEWNKRKSSSKMQSNYLDKLGYSEKISEFEFAVKEMRRYHRLTEENIEISIQNILLLEQREKKLHIENKKKEFEEHACSSVKNYATNYADSIIYGYRMTENGERFAKGTISTWKQFKRIFLDFFAKVPFSWVSINQTLVNRFILYLDELGYMKTSKSKYVKMFKTLVIAAEKDGLHTNYSAKSLFKRIKIREDDKAKEIYLTKEELQALYDMKLDGFEEKVRDVFLIGTYTAQRVSDYSSIDSSCIGITEQGNKVIRFSQQKTKEPVVIPILDDTLEVLLKKYDYNIPNIPDQSINRTIKVVCERLSRSVPSLAKKERTKLKLHERKAEEKAKERGETLFEYDAQGYPIKARWAMVSTHTARRSGITNMYKSKKFSIEQMMHVSGHKTVATFLDYVKLSLDEMADNVASSAIDGLF